MARRLARRRRRDTRVLIIRRRLIECAEQRATLGVGWLGVVEPIDPAQRSGDARDRPPSFRRIGDRHARRGAGRVVVGDDGIRRADPHVAAIFVLVGKAHAEVAPPRHGVDGQRIQLDEISRRTLAVSRNAEAHRWTAIDVGEREAVHIELQVGERIRGATIAAAKQSTRAESGIARRLVCLAAGIGQPTRHRGTEEIGDLARLA